MVEGSVSPEEHGHGDPQVSKGPHVHSTHLFVHHNMAAPAPPTPVHGANIAQDKMRHGASSVHPGHDCTSRTPLCVHLLHDNMLSISDSCRPMIE